MRTKLALMISMVAVVLATLFGGAGTALAQQVIGGAIQCQSDPCVGTGAHQVLFERVGEGDAMDGAIGGPGSDLCVVDAAIEASDTCEGVIYR